MEIIRARHLHRLQGLRHAGSVRVQGILLPVVEGETPPVFVTDEHVDTDKPSFKQTFRFAMHLTQIQSKVLQL